MHKLHPHFPFHAVSTNTQSDSVNSTAKSKNVSHKFTRIDNYAHAHAHAHIYKCMNMEMERGDLIWGQVGSNKTTIVHESHIVQLHRLLITVSNQKLLQLSASLDPEHYKIFPLHTHKQTNFQHWE